MGKQKARALFNPSILCFSTEGKNVALQNLIPLLVLPYFIIFESVYISKYFVFLYPWDAKTGELGHQDADFVFLFPIMV